MNNFTFGDKTFGYYETIAGGSGAGLGWHGQSGVHTHMTNTRITGIKHANFLTQQMLKYWKRDIPSC
jgi:N-methylhydantoinase B/oxoprolinase/acetone carboxylase alpha subunit